MWRCHIFCDGTIILRRLHKVNSFLQENSFLLHFYSYNYQDMPFLCIFNNKFTASNTVREPSDAVFRAFKASFLFILYYFCENFMHAWYEYSLHSHRYTQRQPSLFSLFWGVFCGFLGSFVYFQPKIMHIFTFYSLHKYSFLHCIFIS